MSKDIKNEFAQMPANNCSKTNITNKNFTSNREKYNYLDLKEKEQQRIARDLHDSALQTLTHVIHKTELCSKYIDQDPIKAKLELATISKYLKQTIQEIRNTIFDLHPMAIDDLGLKECLENMFTVLQQDRNIKINYEIDDIKLCTDNLILLNIFHIIQESVRNASKHSGGKNINVTVKEYIDHIYVKIEDDGKGFDIENIESKDGKHFGLSIIKERAEMLDGKFIIQSKINEGTIIELNVKSKIV